MYRVFTAYSVAQLAAAGPSRSSCSTYISGLRTVCATASTEKKGLGEAALPAGQQYVPTVQPERCSAAAQDRLQGPVPPASVKLSAIGHSMISPEATAGHCWAELPP